MFSDSSRKTAIVTGASSGFGYATCEKLVANGWNVVAVARRKERLNSLQDSLGKDVCAIYQLDVTEQQAIEAFASWWKEHSIPLDLLVNNAGLALGLSPADQADLDDWLTMIDTNIKGLVIMTRALLPLMVKAKSGHVVNVGSIAGTYAYPGGNAYGASKAFVAQFSRNLRADLAGTNVRVTNIEPGLAETEFSVVRFHGDQSKADSVYQGVEPLIADDIAEAIVWSTMQPKHVNINSIEIMPTCQSFAPLTITKGE